MRVQAGLTILLYVLLPIFLQFVLDGTWQVVAGEESKEMETQDQREMRVLEAIYPRSSSIPPKCNSCLSFYKFPFCFISFPLFLYSG